MEDSKEIIKQRMLEMASRNLVKKEDAKALWKDKLKEKTVINHDGKEINLYKEAVSFWQSDAGKKAVRDAEYFGP